MLSLYTRTRLGFDLLDVALKYGIKILLFCKSSDIQGSFSMDNELALSFPFIINLVQLHTTNIRTGTESLGNKNNIIDLWKSQIKKIIFEQLEYKLNINITVLLT